MGDRPNILLITSDQQHWSTLGCLNPEISTPNLDRLAVQGTLFERAYCPNPTCTPTRASMITGKYPSQHGAWSLGTKLPESEHTVGEDFTAAGYRTSLVGKAHFQPLQATEEFSSLESYPILQDLNFWRNFEGPFYGFEQVRLARNHADEAHVGQHYALWMEERGLANWRDYFRPPTGNNSTQRHRWDIPEEFHYDAWIAEETCGQLSDYAGKGENFFLWASFLRSATTLFSAGAMGSNVRSGQNRGAGNFTRRARGEPTALRHDARGVARFFRLEGKWLRHSRL